MAQTEVKSIFPLDKNRKLISETKDELGYLHKVFRLYAPNGDSIDIELEEKQPIPILKPLDRNRRIIAQEQGPDGYLHKIMICEANGVTQEYFITEKIPDTNSHKRLHGHADAQQVPEPGVKKSKESKDDYQVSDEFMHLLLKMKVEQLTNTPDGGIHIYVALRTQLASHVFGALVDHGFLSCPVVNKDGVTYYGFVDMIDFIHYFIGEAKGKEAQIQTLSVLDHKELFKEKRVKDIIPYPLSKRNPFHPLKKGYSLYSVFEVLIHERLHRVPIISETGKIVNLITQSQLVSFALKNIHIMGTIKNKPLMMIPHLFKTVVSVTTKERAIVAFEKMIEMNITGVAVVNATNRLVGNISTRDFKGIKSRGQWWVRLFFTAEKYLEAATEGSNRPPGPVYVYPSDTLEKVLKLLDTHKIHRVYIVNNEKELHPLGLVSLTDIVREIVAPYA